MRRVIVASVESRDPYADGWEHAHVNSLACFDLAISELRRNLLEQRAQDATGVVRRDPVTGGEG